MPIPAIDTIALKKYAEAARKVFSSDSFRTKLKECGRKIGKDTLKMMLQLYYLLRKPEVPASVKAIITAALGYFILPIDLIPDFIPVAGFVDDIAVITAAVIQASRWMDDEIRAKANAKIDSWFGNDDDVIDI